MGPKTTLNPGGAETTLVSLHRLTVMSHMHKPKNVLMLSLLLISEISPDLIQDSVVLGHQPSPPYRVVKAAGTVFRPLIDDTGPTQKPLWGFSLLNLGDFLIDNVFITSVCWMRRTLQIQDPYFRGCLTSAFMWSLAHVMIRPIYLSYTVTRDVQWVPFIVWYLKCSFVWYVDTHGTTVRQLLSTRGHSLWKRFTLWASRFVSLPANEGLSWNCSLLVFLSEHVSHYKTPALTEYLSTMDTGEEEARWWRGQHV